MSIKILAQQTLEVRQKSNLIRETPLILNPIFPKDLIHRLKRFESLQQKENELAPYHAFCSLMTEIQRQITQESPLDLTNIIDPNSIKEQQEHILEQVIQTYLPELSRLLQKQSLTDEMKMTLAQLDDQEDSLKTDKCHFLLNGEFEKVSANEALLIWNAMMIAYRQIAAHLKITAKAEFGEKRFLCPICHSHPVASEIAIGKEEGLRYLHCSLCEMQWNVPRVKCTYCDNLEGLLYYSIDEINPNIKAESCPKCKSYLKIIHREKAPELDAIADELDSFILDEEMEKLGYAKSGRNPFLF